MTTIKFDRNSVSWRDNDAVNQYYLDTQLQFFNTLLEARSYLYLSSIYEILGVKWNPDWKNICFLAEFGELYYEIERNEENEEYLIKIYQ
jgi:hypothetical protein